MEDLRKRIEGLGVPLILMRKFNQLTGAISVQVEDEFTSRRVIETVFCALIEQAEEIRQPESDQIKTWILETQRDIEARLNKRNTRTKP